MNSKTIAYGILRAVAIILGIAGLLWLLYTIRFILVYIAFAAVISLMGRNLVLFLKRRLKFGNTLAVMLTLCISIGILLSIFALFIPIITEQSQYISAINLEQWSADFDQLNADISSYLNVEKLSLVELIKRTDLMQFLDLKGIPNLINSLLGGFGSLLIGLFSVLFISFFLLKDSLLLEKSLLVFAQKEDEGKFMKAFTKIKDLLSRYFIGLLFQILILFVLYTILLLIFGVDNAIAVALIAAILNIIPYVGPLFGGGLILMLATTSHLGEDFQTVLLPKLSYLLLGYFVIQLVDNFVNQPLIFSNSVRSHPLEIFLSILIGGVLFGIPGMIVAVPSYTAIKVISKEFLSEYKIVKQLTKDL